MPGTTVLRREETKRLLGLTGFQFGQEKCQVQGEIVTQKCVENDGGRYLDTLFWPPCAKGHASSHTDVNILLIQAQAHN